MGKKTAGIDINASEVYGAIEKIGAVYNIIKSDGSCIGILHKSFQNDLMKTLDKKRHVTIIGNVIKNGCGKSLICSADHCGPEMIVLESVKD